MFPDLLEVTIFEKFFSRLGLKPQVVLSAADTDVIKTYVREGFGVETIVSKISFRDINPVKETDTQISMQFVGKIQ